MIATNNLTVPYAQALLAATPNNMLVQENSVKKATGVTPEGNPPINHRSQK